MINDLAHRLATRSAYFAGPLVSTFTAARVASGVGILASLALLLASVAGWYQLSGSAGIAFGIGCIVGLS